MSLPPLNIASPLGSPGASPLGASPLGPLSPGLPLPTVPTTAPANPLVGGFESLLTETMQLEQSAQSNIETALTGGDITQAEVLASVKKADLSLRLLMQLRNKTLAAYNELQQMRF